MIYDKAADGTIRGYITGTYGVGKRTLGSYKDLVQEIRPDGTETRWDSWGRVTYEKLSDGTEREFYKDGQLKAEKLPDGTKIKYDQSGNIIYHATKGKEDTAVYLAKQRVAEKKEKQMEKLKNKSESTQKVLGEIADSKAFQNVAVGTAVVSNFLKKKFQKRR